MRHHGRRTVDQPPAAPNRRRHTEQLNSLRRAIVSRAGIGHRSQMVSSGLSRNASNHFFLRVLISSLDHWACVRSKSRELGLEFGSRTDRIEFPAEVAQLVEQWSEESRSASLIEFLRESATDTD